MRAAPALLFLFALLSLPTVTLAQTSETDESARMHFEAGRSYFDRARYDDAVREFEEAYRLSNRIGLLVNISRSHEAAGRTPEAADALGRWLATAPADDPMRHEIEGRVARLQLQIQAETERREREAAEAAANPLEPSHVAAPETAAPRVVAPVARRSPAPFVLIGAGVAAAGVGAALVALGYGDVHTVENPAPDTAWTDAADIHARAERRLGLGYSLLGVGVGVAAAAGGIVWRIASAPDEHDVAIHVLPTGLAVRGSF